MKESWFPSHLAPIPPEECLELLAGEPVGRVAYCDLHGPVVLPVNHVLSGGSIWFRTSPDSELARHLRDAGPEAAVGFEVDQFDTYTE
jgi:nitroimidazol reductase NimA-like FMN-containing flavoprotein (pyridoxamine 5'-phosphate oxidase superfamily)